MTSKREQKKCTKKNLEMCTDFFSISIANQSRVIDELLKTHIEWEKTAINPQSTF